MKRKFIVISLFTVLHVTTVFGQDSTEVYSEGLQVSISGNIVGWSSTDVDMKDEIGWGISGEFGYNLTENFGIQTPISISRFNPSDGGDYNQFKIGAGVEYRFGKDRDQVRPLVNTSYNAIWLYQPLEAGDLNIISYGPGIGAGVLLNVTDELYLRLLYNRYWSDITTVKIGNESFDGSGNLRTDQFTFGLVVYFQ